MADKKASTKKKKGSRPKHKTSSSANGRNGYH
jgi:hypothetical protein